jgi:hypothetical protein
MGRRSSRAAHFLSASRFPSHAAIATVGETPAPDAAHTRPGQPPRGLGARRSPATAPGAPPATAPDRRPPRRPRLRSAVRRPSPLRRPPPVPVAPPAPEHRLPLAATNAAAAPDHRGILFFELFNVNASVIVKCVYKCLFSSVFYGRRELTFM